MPKVKAAQRLKLNRSAVLFCQRARRSRSTLPPTFGPLEFLPYG